MKRYLCLDIGDKRIGVAVSDPFNSYALPVKTYFRQNLKKDVIAIGELVKEKCATDIVCGLPVNFDGTQSVQTKKAQFFIDRLKEELGVNVITVDERCTTCEAEEILIKEGKSRKERKQVVDALASQSILDGYLRSLVNKENTMSKKDLEKEHNHCCDCGCEEHEHTHDDCCCEDEDIVTLTADDGKKLKFFFVGTIEFKGKNYSAFEPAEDIEGLSEDDLVIFELVGADDEEGAELLPVEDEKLLDEVFEEFCRVLDEDEAQDAQEENN